MADATTAGNAAEPTAEIEHRFQEEARQLRSLLQHGRYAEFIATAQALGPLDPALAERRDTLVGHARIALQHDREAEIAAARDRERSSRWLTTGALLETIGHAVRERQPLAFIRLGDGEARFTLTMDAAMRPGLSTAEAWALSRPVWNVRFHERIDAVDPLALSDLFADYCRAVRMADILGVSTAERLAGKPNIFGFLAAQEAWLRRLLVDRPGVLFADALAHHRLHERSHFLGDLLSGIDTLGVIGPHPELAHQLALRFGIPVAHSIPVPGETVLPDAARMHAQGRHFPERYREVLAELAVPRPGTVFLVAAGLLGKVYCARIKELGGIALDIGSVADLWMGFDTRPGYRSEAAAP